MASHVEMLSGRRKKDYEAQQAADSLASQAGALGDVPASEPIPDGTFDPGSTDEDDDEAEADDGRGGGLTEGQLHRRRRGPCAPSPRRQAAGAAPYLNSKKETRRIA